jgi:hypothetical protein
MTAVGAADAARSPWIFRQLLSAVPESGATPSIMKP